MQISKAVVMVAAAFCTAVTPLLITAAPLSTASWINVLVMGLGAAQVYIAKNLPDDAVWTYTKAIMAGLSTAATLLMSMLSDSHITGSEWAQVVVAAIATIGVYAVPNTDPAATGKHEAPPLRPVIVTDLEKHT